MTKPLAGRVEARIVGTIGGTAHRPRPKRRYTQRRGSEHRRYTPHNHRQFTGNFPYTPMYPVNRPRAKDNDEPAELPARPTL